MKNQWTYVLVWLTVPVIAVGVYPLIKADPKLLKVLTVAFGIYVLFFSVVIHELCHGLAALWCGDTTARDGGRLTLNPVSHVSVVGSIILPLVLYFSHASMVFGFARPVPFNPLGLRRHPRDQVALASAGPLSNLALSYLFFLVYLVAGMLLRQASSASVPPLLSDLSTPMSFAGASGEAVWFVVFELAVAGTVINASLAVFNLVPFPPLDGGWVLKALLPVRITAAINRFQPVALVVLMVVLVAKPGMLLVMLYPVLLIAGAYQGIANLCLG
jgi:Zn-dependent protease